MGGADHIATPDAPAVAPGGPPGACRIWLLIGLITSAAVALGVLASGSATAPLLHGVPWWALVALFAATEVAAVHLHFNGESHTFTFTEVAMVAGLLSASPLTLLGVHLLGAAAARAIRGRQAVVKQAFNTALGALDTLAAVLVFNALRGDARASSPKMWLAITAALLLTTVVSSTVVAVAISVTSARSSRPAAVAALRQTLRPAIIVTLANTSFGLAAAAVYASSRLSLVLLAVPAVTLWGAYHAYTAQQQTLRSVELLHRCSQVFHGTPDHGAAIEALLEETRDAFGAARAELILVGGHAYRASGMQIDLGGSDPGAGRDRPPLPAGLVAAAANLLARRGPTVVDRRPGGHGELIALLDEREVDDAIVAAVDHNGTTIGVLFVGGRLAAVDRFTRRDASLLEALAVQISTGLESKRLVHAITELETAQQRLTHQATHDTLTGLANRKLFLQRLEEACGEGVAGTETAVLFVDLDDFKAVNDTFGHHEGDVFLKAVATRLESAIRSRGTVARLGGDEFAVVLPEVAGQADADLLVDRMLERFTVPVMIAGTSLPISASVGGALLPSGSLDPESTADTLLRNADVAMYAAKAQGKSRAVWFDEQMDRRESRRSRMREDLHSAIAAGAIDVAFQPIVHLTRGQVVAVEALARWSQPQVGGIAPEEFVLLAEQTGLAVALGRAVRVRAVREFAHLAATSGTADLALHVNISAAELRDPEFEPVLLALLAREAITPSRLVIEVAERMIVDHDARTMQTLTDLRAQGVRIALDDFGTGFSSLGYLRWLPVDVLKIDRSFLIGIEDSATARALLASMVQFGTALGLQTIVEGLETGAQVAVLDGLEQVLGQGYYVGRPVAPADLSASSGLTSLPIP
jgi:diguanylate cyclase (GGDEF)-like protein